MIVETSQTNTQSVTYVLALNRHPCPGPVPETLEPNSSDEDIVADFESDTSDLESSLDDLTSAIDNLEGAEDKDEREDAIAEIEEALAQTIAAFEAALQYAVIGSEKRQNFEQECLAVFKEAAKVPQENRVKLLLDWVESAGTPDVIEKRRMTLMRLLKPNEGL